MKKILTALSLLIVMGCSGKNYSITEGPFRGKFTRSFSITHVNRVWNMPILLSGVLPEGAVHVEGYLDNRYTSYLQMHADLPYIRTRIFNVRNVFTVLEYCEALGQPVDEFGVDATFPNRQMPRDENSIERNTQNTDVIVTIRFRFLEFFQDIEGKWKPGKFLFQTQTKVELDCPQCRCNNTF